jgi:hypothetical protein
VGFEPTIPTLERAKTFYALDRAATVIGVWWGMKNVFAIMWERKGMIKDVLRHRDNVKR